MSYELLRVRTKHRESREASGADSETLSDGSGSVSKSIELISDSAGLWSKM
jgi:hypothetical protein